VADNRNIIQNEVVLDGEADIVQARRTSIKLAEKPRIVVAMPIGAKPVTSVLPLDGKLYQVSDGFRAPGLIPVEFMLSHMNWVPPLNVSMAYMVKKNMLSSHARQVMTKEAIRMGAEYIFYVDDDTIIPALGLYTLYNFMERNPHAGAVSGVYTTRENPNEPLIYQKHGEGCSWDFEMGPGAKPELIFGAGAGCLLARVSAIADTIDQMQEEAGQEIPIWADEKDLPADIGSTDQQRVMWGHDIRFCRMLNKHGHPVYVDGRVLCGHHDVRTGQTFVVPDDAPGFQKTRERLGNINTAPYWDQVYTREGADSWRKYPEMFQAVCDALDSYGEPVVELGCGVGILGSKITAEHHKRWIGYDISPAAVEMAKTRFLDARVLDVRELTPDHLEDATTVVMTELVEHLNQQDAIDLLVQLDTTEQVTRIIFTTPDGCMGPDEVPEHTALFDADYVRDLLDEAQMTRGQWSISIDKADDHHLICVMER
jgi:hypothetical protein